MAHQGWTAGAAAPVLERTVFAVKARRALLRKRGVLPPRCPESIEVVIPPGWGEQAR